MNDWSNRIKALEASGLSLTKIAQEIGLSLSGLSDIKQGRSGEPRGMAAVKLHGLYEKVCRPGAPPKSAPRRAAA